jgi:O-antigen/teichoic acid export membrane protein
MTASALSLMTATIATNATGLLFWAVAARIKSPREVGHAAALVAAATLLATLAQLNLTNVFIRLIPNSGHLAKTLVLRGYAAVTVFAVTLGVIYLVTGLSGNLISGIPVARLTFVLSVVALAIFSLQDSVLTALRLAPWVAVENVSYSVTKLILLPVPALLLGITGILMAWVVPAAVAVAVVTWLLIHRVFPTRERLEGKLPPVRKLLNFVAAEYVGNSCSTATAQMMPLVIIWRLGAPDAAYFTLPWLVAQGVGFLMWNIGSSFVVELAAAHGHVNQLVRRGGALLAGVTLSALIVCVLAAHPLLEIIGARYADHGTTLLRLIGLSLPFSAVVVIYSTLAWVDQRVWLLAGFLALSGSALMLTTLVLLPKLGLSAAGWAYLGTQAAAALIMGPLAVARLRRGQLTPTT